MSDIVALFALFVLITIAVGGAVEDENRLKSLSLAWVIFLLISFPTLSSEWARMTSELIDDENDSHLSLIHI